MSRIILVSNRVPRPGDQGVSHGGLLVGLSHAASKEALWFGWSGKTSDPSGSIKQMKSVGGIEVAAIDLTPTEYEQYYVGYANRVLWPLFHFRLGLMEYLREYADAYFSVNRKFARALAPILKPDDVIWVQDYHLIPLGSALRAAGANNRLGFFLHTPFVPPSMLMALPDGEQLLRDICTYNVVGFQTSEHRRDFFDCVSHMLGTFPTSDENIVSDRHRTKVLAVPVGIDVKRFARDAKRSWHAPETRRLVESMGYRSLIIGVDRLDYSKGLPNRIEAYSRLLRFHPEHVMKVSYLQVAAKTREDVDEYQMLKRELDRMIGKVNGRFAEFDWVPIRYLTRALARATLAGFYRAARVALVTPLRDGMNLVAKEFVAAQESSDPGVLVLSKFAGAAEHLQAALVVNPFDPDDIAENLHRALTMDLEERRERHARLFDVVSSHCAQNFFCSFLTALVDRVEAPTSTVLPRQHVDGWKCAM
jgi:trehalose 6-phosphate synthase